MIIFVVIVIIKILSIVISLLIAVAYFTIAERKIMGSIQRRKGPNIIGFIGLLQPFADGLKLFAKETILPSNANINIFFLAPTIAFVLSLLGWAVMPIAEGIVIADLSLGMLYLLAASSLNIYGLLLAGWSSNSKYAYLGAIRSAAQMISYEIAIGFSILCVILCTGSFNLSITILAQNKIWLVVPLFPIFIIFYISMLAETNRHPFDLTEAEAELVAGYNVEYSAMIFALFFLAEYGNMLIMSLIAAILFFGGWFSLILFFNFNLILSSIWLSIKICLGSVFFIITRATLPRYRYDQLMYLGWKCFLPLTLSYLICIVGILIGFNWLPN